MTDSINNHFRLVSRCSIVQIDQRVSVHFLMKCGKLMAYVIDVYHLYFYIQFNTEFFGDLPRGKTFSP